MYQHFVSSMIHHAGFFIHFIEETSTFITCLDFMAAALSILSVESTMNMLILTEIKLLIKLSMAASNVEKYSSDFIFNASLFMDIISMMVILFTHMPNIDEYNMTYEPDVDTIEYGTETDYLVESEDEVEEVKELTREEQVIFNRLELEKAFYKLNEQSEMPNEARACIHLISKKDILDILLGKDVKMPVPDNIKGELFKELTGLIEELSELIEKFDNVKDHYDLFGVLSELYIISDRMTNHRIKYYSGPAYF